MGGFQGLREFGGPVGECQMRSFLAGHSQIAQAFLETGCRSKARGHELGPHCPPGDVQSMHVCFGPYPQPLGCHW